MNADEDTVDLIKTDVFQYIRKLEKQKALLSVYLLVDSFLAIAESFSLNPSEYEYYLEKYNTAEISGTDLKKTDIIDYLKNIIFRLEKVTDKTFNVKNLKIYYTDAEKEAAEEELAEEEAQLREELSEFPELQEILDETKQDSDVCAEPDPSYPVPCEEFKRYLELKKQPITNTTIKVVINVFSLKHYQFLPAIPLIKYNKERNEK